MTPPAAFFGRFESYRAQLCEPLQREGFLYLRKGWIVPKTLAVVSLAILVLLGSCAKDHAASHGAPAATRAVEYDVYSGYFVSNQFEPDAATSFVVIADQATFDRIFGVAQVMRDQSHRLPPHLFDSHIVLAVIKRGKEMWHLKAKQVSVQNHTLTLGYVAHPKQSGSATFATPLIVSVPRGDYISIRFSENGTPIKTVDLPH